MSVAARLSEVKTPPVAVRLQQAIAYYRDGDMISADSLFCGILRDDPGHPHALHMAGLIAHKRGDLEMAERLIERAVKLHPHSRAAHNLGVVLAQQGRLDAAIAVYRQALQLEPDYLEAAMNLLFALDLHPHATPDLLLAERRAFAEAFCDPLTRMAPPHGNDRDPDRRLRVGYVSPDFRHHSAATSFSFLLAHDPEVVEVHLYSTAMSHDDASEPFKARADLWAEVGHLSDAEIAQIVREDQVDILVDLAGYSQGGRPLLFAMKPAPVQVTGWGYATGTGMAAMDYLASDAVAVPAEHERHYTEKIMRLPCLLSYAPGGAVPVFAETPPEQRNGYRTYGYLGRAQKVNEPTLALWARIMREDPTSRLLLKHGQWEPRVMRDRVAQTLWALGVSPDRIEVRGQTSRLEHLAAYNEIDVALDPLGMGGGVTVADACLMGVPTVTLLGETIPSRTGASILEAVRYREWTTVCAEDYITMARLGSAERPLMRQMLLGSVLCDSPRYARAVEAQYRQAWQRWCGEAA